MYKTDVIPASRHFAVKDHIFNGNGSFIVIEQIRKSISGETKKELLKQKELLKLETKFLRSMINLT